MDEADLKEVIDLCKQGKAGNNTALRPNPLKKADLPANPSQGAAVSLVSIAIAPPFTSMKKTRFPSALSALIFRMSLRACASR